MQKSSEMDLQSGPVRSLAVAKILSDRGYDLKDALARCNAFMTDYYQKYKTISAAWPLTEQQVIDGVVLTTADAPSIIAVSKRH